ncbi:MAG: PLP-dependent lyase/thiolase [Bacilli bacterium]|nr:PLP-dependent lyase/thiolase [Bacilli bacterium]MBN2696734.1 PLP-dependent lyase/thiolase [Bacilli bacterium]
MSDQSISYSNLLEQKNEIMKASVGIDYDQYKIGKIAFDYEKMLADTGYKIEDIEKIQSESGVGNTPLKELKNISALARKHSPKGYGARIFIKDEALNDSGSFKARRASISCYQAKKQGYKGVIAATSGNYGAAVASQAAKYGLKCIIVQECYDSRGVGQPEIIEKARACEAYGAEVIQLTVGPELFYTFLLLLKETGYFNASLYSPYSVLGIETLGKEIITDCLKVTGKTPDAVIITNAGGGNLTGTTRGIRKATDNKVQIIAASVNLKGLHMASDNDFNRKSFTTGHTGFGIPFVTNPDRSDVPRSAARPLRYMDRYVTVNQGQVFFVTEALTALEGIERGPAGNTSLAAAIAIAREMKSDQIIVVQETEYTSAGKHHQAQLDFAKKNGILVEFGDPHLEVPGKSIILPRSVDDLFVEDIQLDYLRESYLRNVLKGVESISEADIDYLIKETNSSHDYIRRLLDEFNIRQEEQL